MNNDSEIAWEDFLNPDILRTSLIVVSLFITAFEMLKDSVVERVKDFYMDGFDEKGMIVNNKYKTEVLALNKSPLYSSFQWLINHKAIDEKDIDVFNNIKACRNELVHDIVNIISKGIKNDPLPLFRQMIDLLYKIEKWWIVNVEIPTDPDLYDKEIDENGIVPGKIMSMRLLLDIALGSKEESEFYFKEFIKRKSSI